MAKKKERDNSITKNRRASFEFALEERYEAGIVLTGPEIKSIRAKKVSISEAYCYIDSSGILRIKGMRISEFKNAGYMLQNPDREKLLLLTKNELKKINNKLKDQGNTIVPIEVFISPKGFAKVEIAIARGKKYHDKRESLKDKDVQREISRYQ
ncbi:MAG: SsrA-binding protein SmpB [Bacteroidetes bacterium]|nr:SsrA-binding protein SmpB [Bacteroidota bacterium]